MITKENCLTNKTSSGSSFMLCFLACDDKWCISLKNILVRIVLESIAPHSRVAALMGFSCKKMYMLFARTKKVAVTAR